MEAYPSPPSSPRPLSSDEQLELTNLLQRVPRIGYSDRTESQRHLSPSSTLDLIRDRDNDGSQDDERNEFDDRDGGDDGADNDNINDREEDETNTPGHTLSASAPVSLDPRMDLESGAYVSGNIVHGVVSQDGTMLFQVQNPTHALRIRTLAPDAVRTVVSPVQRYGFLSTDPSDYSLEIPNWHPVGSDADGVTDDDDETWVPIDRSRRTRTVGVNGGMELVDEQQHQQQASEDLAPLQRRYPRSFNRVATTIHHTHLASAGNSSIPEEVGSEQTSPINAAEVTRQEIELNASDASIDSIATGLITNIVEQVLRNLQSTASTQPEIDSNPPATTLTRSNATTRGTRVLSSQQRESALRQANVNPPPSFSTSNRREAPIFNLSDLNTSLENAPFTPSLSRRTTLSRQAEDDHFHTTGIPSRQEYIGAMRGMSAFAPSASSSSWTPVDDDPWIMAVRTFEARFRRGFSSFGSADIVTAVAAAALRSAREDESSSGSSSEQFSYTSTRRNMRRRISHDQNHLAERISVGVIDWTRRAQVSVTRRLYRTRDSLLEQDSALVMNPFISPNSSRPTSAEGSTLSNRMLGNPRIVDDTTVWVPEVDESVVFEMPLCEWLLTRGLLDSNGDIVEDASALNQRSRNGAQYLTQDADARASAHISYSLQGRRRFPEICGFDVPEGGANLLHMGLDANGCPVSDSALTIRVEEAVFELDEHEVSSNPDALRRVGVMHVEADYGGFPVLR
ncbi:hypothetical protein HDU77_008093 [Chytriomyces hyalinus]|nr:hypothetical protein HDU77_008093 [Chytriomyces hyalinus]